MKGVPEARLRTILTWAVILLTAGPLGTAVVLGVGWGESPCILCWAQRTSMALVALTGIFILRYGPRSRYLGAVVIMGTWGLFMALRHSALHLARDIGQGFAGAFFGAHTYIWSGAIHWSILLALGSLLFLLKDDTVQTGPRDLRRIERFAVGFFVVVIGANALQAFVTTGPPPFMGQADPLRFSLNPARWVWLADDELSGAVSLRGSWTVPAPDPAFHDVDPDPGTGPLATLPSLEIGGWEEVAAPLEGRLTDLAYVPATGGYLAVTDRHGVYVLDAALQAVVHGVTLDPHFAVELTPLAGAAVMGDTLVAMSTNKSYAMVRVDPEADEGYEWRHFLTTTGGVAQVRRSRLATVRARQQYVLAAAYDGDADELITVSVPSDRHRRMVISRFDRSDLVLSSEFLPGLGRGLSFTGADGTLADYVVTGAVALDGLLYLVSAAHSTVLEVDLHTRSVVRAWAIPGLEQPVGITVRGDQWLIAQADGRVAVVPRPGIAAVEGPP